MKKSDSSKSKSRKKTAALDPASTLQRLAQDKATLFRDDRRHPYASVHINGAVRHVPIKSPEFNYWLRRSYREANGRVAPSKAVSDAIQDLAVDISLSGSTAETFTRFAEHQGEIYLDLGGDNGSAVRITKSGWFVDPNPPVKFLRPDGLKELPMPQEAPVDALNDLQKLINVPADEDFRLVLAWLLSCLRPSIPTPVLALTGEQGSAKTTTARMLRLLIDPNAAALRKLPATEEDLMIAAINSGVIGLDNVSGFHTWLSDALCRLVTGTADGKRTKYTDVGETLLSARRPVLLNGISDYINRGDLLDRAIVLRLPAVRERLTETALMEQFESLRPRMIGALCTLAVSALSAGSGLNYGRPRMADFADWTSRAEAPMGWTPGSLMKAYEAKTMDADMTILEEHTWLHHIAVLADRGWTGTASDLIKLLHSRNFPGLPKNGRAMRAQLDRVAPHLRRLGVELAAGRTNHRNRTRLITISKAKIKIGTVTPMPSGYEAA